MIIASYLSFCTVLPFVVVVVVVVVVIVVVVVVCS